VSFKTPNKIQKMTGVVFGGIEDVLYFACACTLTATTGCRT